MRITIFYFIADSFPVWRVDLVELFSVQLKRLGVETTWSVRRSDSGFMKSVDMHGQTTILPLSLGKQSVIAKLLNRVLEPFSELLIFLRLIFGKSYDVIQVRDDRYSAALFAMLAARLRGSRFVYWLSFPFPEHDLAMAAQSRGVRKWYLSLRGTFAGWWLYGIVLKTADHVFVQSDRMRDNLLSQGIPVGRMTPVPMGVPFRLLDWAAQDTTAAEPGRIVYLGTLSESRQLGCVLEAFSLVRQRFPHVTLWMVGEGDFPHERVKLEEIAFQLGCSNNVVFSGFVPIDEAWRLAKSAEICLSPMISDAVIGVASPTKLIEYMALARPVVANNHPEQTFVLQQCEAGVLVNWGVHEFAEGICSVLVDLESAVERAKLGPSWVSANRSYDHIASWVMNIYISILEIKDNPYQNHPEQKG